MTNIDDAIMTLRKARRDELKRTETPRFMAQEVAYRLPGKAWARKTIKTEAAFLRFVGKMDEQGAELYTRDAD